MSIRPSMAALLLAMVLVAAPCGAADLRVVTYNVWHGLGQMQGLALRELESSARRENRFRWLVRRLGETRPDVVLLQEVNPVADYTRRLMELVPGYTEIHQADNCGIKIAGVGIPSNFHQGLTILAREELALEPRGYRRLSGDGWCGEHSGRQTTETHIALAGSIRWRGARILVVNTHLHGGASATPSMHEELEWLRTRNAISGEAWDRIRSYLERSARRRAREMQALAAWVREQSGDFDAIIVGGDFNTEPGEPALKPLTSLGLVDALERADWDGATFDVTRNAENIDIEATDWATTSLDELDLPREMQRRIETLFELDFYRPKRLDHVYVSGSLGALVERAGPYMTAPTPNGYLASDHIGVMVQLALPERHAPITLSRRP